MAPVPPRRPEPRGSRDRAERSPVAAPARPTMKDVAARAGVSVQTVSNVINAREGTAGPETRERVEQAMEELGYHPNVSGRALRSSRTDTMALLLRDETESFLADPLTNLITAGIGDVLREEERGLLIQTAKPGGRREGLLAPILQSRVDGAFVLLSGDREMRLWYVEQLARLGRPFVVFDEVLDDRSILSVRAADRDAGRSLAEYLIGKGHTRIAFIGARSPWAVVEQRHLGYEDAMRAAGLRPDRRLQIFAAGWQSSGGAEITHELLSMDRPPSAIMCGSDVLAVGAIQAAKARGLRVPDDVAVTGFDDFAFSSFIEPQLTTIRVPGYEMGQVAAEMLLAEVDGRGPRVRQVVLPTQLVIRGST
jgi:DNA-binding LacI/PurR family transcriptional regulator